MRIRIYCLLAMLWPVINSYAQSPGKPIKPLSIGDTIPPDLELTNVYNYPVSKIRFSELKGKLIILDFWATWCGACIAAFPHLNTLKEKFEKDLSIFLVNSKTTKDDKQKVKTFFEKRNIKTGRANKLPLIIGDSVLERMFIHHTLPHYVWINNKGVVQAITESTEVTERNIRSVLLDGKKMLRSKQNNTPFDMNKPLFTRGNLGAGQADLFIGRSILTGWRAGENGFVGQRRNAINEITGFYMFNKPLLTLLTSAYSEYSFQKNRLIIESATPICLEYKGNDPKLYDYLYCYDLSVPPVSFEKLQQYIREDIYRYFHIRVTKQQKRVNCLIVTATEQLGKSASRYTTPEAELENVALKKYLYGYTVAGVIATLDRFSDLPIIDETHLGNKIDIDLPFSLTDTTAILESLMKAGFSVRKEERTLELTVITKS